MTQKYRHGWVQPLDDVICEDIERCRQAMAPTTTASFEFYEKRLSALKEARRRLYLFDFAYEMRRALEAVNRALSNSTTNKPLEAKIFDLLQRIEAAAPVRSFDVFMESFVNVVIPEEVDPDSDEGYQMIREAATEKYLKALDSHLAEFTWKEYKDGTYVEDDTPAELPG